VDGRLRHQAHSRGRILRAFSSQPSAPPVTVYTHKECLNHRVMFHPECPERLRHLIEDVIPPLQEELGFEVVQPPRLPEKNELARVHTTSYVDSVYDAFSQIDEGLVPSVYLDADTEIMPGSDASILRGAGATLQAVEDVCEGKALRAFVMVRPPGHHAEPNAAMGFCVFNNIMVGLAHAQAKYPDVIQRAALLDFDVHHGNGGQTACWSEPERFFASTHQSPLFPWKGKADDTGSAMNVINVPLAKNSTSADFRRAWEEKIIPTVRDFAPDIIFASAGFDAHADDPLASLNLQEDDFHFVTDKIANLANEVAGGRLVTVLEGGYDPAALGRCVGSHIRALNDAPRPSEEQISFSHGSKTGKTRAPQMMYSQQQIQAMDKGEIRSALSRHGLPTSGKLDALRERLAKVPV